MKKNWYAAACSLALLLGASGCGQASAFPAKQVVTMHSTSSVPAAMTAQSIVFKEDGFESSFTLPEGWSYKKIGDNVKADGLLPNGAGYDRPDVPGVHRFSFFDEQGAMVGGISLFAADKKLAAESSFDDCWRSWDIGQDPAGNGMESGQFLDHYMRVTTDSRTSITAESCGAQNDHMAYIYWAPGAVITRQSSLQQLYGKKALRIMALHTSVLDSENFVAMVHAIVKSVTVR